MRAVDERDLRKKASRTRGTHGRYLTDLESLMHLRRVMSKSEFIHTLPRSHAVGQKIYDIIAF